MKEEPASQAVSLNRLIERVVVPPRAVGIFWLGGLSLAFKSPLQFVYLVDPRVPGPDVDGPVGAIDVRPDLVLCTLETPGKLDLSTLAHLATAFPSAQFAASEEARDWMIGRAFHRDMDEVPIDPGRVHALMSGERVDARQLGLRDSVRIEGRHDTGGEFGGPWNVLWNFSGILVGLVRRLSDAEAVDRLCGEMSRRVDVLMWSLEGPEMAGVSEAVDRLRPRYVIPIGYDRFKGGRDFARRFRDFLSRFRDVNVYRFSEDYLEGLLYSRIMRRRR